MEKIEQFSGSAGKHSFYPWRTMAADGGIWQMRAGQDYHVSDRSVRNAAASWANRHGLKVQTINPEPGVIELQFYREEDA